MCSQKDKRLYFQVSKVTIQLEENMLTPSDDLLVQNIIILKYGI